MIGIKLTPDSKKFKAVITFQELHTSIEEAEGADPEEAENGEKEIIKKNKFKTESEFMPHKDFIKAMDKLTKFALDLGEINDEDTSNYHCVALKIDGDMVMKQSRVTLSLEKFVDRTSATLQLGDMPQCEMYGDSDYGAVKQLSKAVEEVVEEAYAFLAGKYGDDSKGQLPLFERVMMKVA